ncbi:hypothetical protein ACFLWA_04305 [Chloroflexota bacterium]
MPRRLFWGPGQISEFLLLGLIWLSLNADPKFLALRSTFRYNAIE